MAYQGAAVGLLMVVGAVGVLTEVGTLRSVFGALAVAGIVRLAVLPRQPASGPLPADFASAPRLVVASDLVSVVPAWRSHAVTKSMSSSTRPRNEGSRSA